MYNYTATFFRFNIQDYTIVCVCWNVKIWFIPYFRLLCDVSDRIGTNVEEVKAHTFFKGTDWDHIRFGMERRQVAVVHWSHSHSRDRPAAIPVHVKHMADTSNFDDFEELSDQKKCWSNFLSCRPFDPLLFSLSLSLSLPLPLSLQHSTKTAKKHKEIGSFRTIPSKGSKASRREDTFDSN